MPAFPSSSLWPRTTGLAHLLIALWAASPSFAAGGDETAMPSGAEATKNRQRAEPSAPPTPSRMKSRDLVGLRLEVQDLAARLREARAQHHAVQRGLSGRLAHLEQQKSELTGRVRALSTGSAGPTAEAVSTWMRAVREVRAVLQESIPFRIRERVRPLDELETHLGGDHPSLSHVLLVLERVIQAEIELSSASGLAPDVIELEGEERRVELAHLGTVALFFKTADDQVGLYDRTHRSGPFRIATEPASKEAIEMFFEALHSGHLPERLVLPPSGQRPL